MDVEESAASSIVNLVRVWKRHATKYTTHLITFPWMLFMHGSTLTYSLTHAHTNTLLLSLSLSLPPITFLLCGHGQISKEGDSFPVPTAVATMSELVKTMMDEDEEENDDQDGSSTPEIPLPNVKAQVLKKVIEFCDHHLAEPMTEIEKPLKSPNMADVVQKWYADFVDLEQVLLFELILAANYMDIKPLLDLTCATVASMIKGKTPEEIRATFNITNDFSPEEEAQVRDENKWCEEA